MLTCLQSGTPSLTPQLDGTQLDSLSAHNQNLIVHTLRMYSLNAYKHSSIARVLTA